MQLRKCKTAAGNNELKFSPDGKTIVVGGWKGIFQLFDTQTCHLLSTHNGHTLWNQITDLVFLKDGKTLASASKRRHNYPLGLGKNLSSKSLNLSHETSRNCSLIYLVYTFRYTINNNMEYYKYR